MGKVFYTILITCFTLLNVNAQREAIKTKTSSSVDIYELLASSNKYRNKTIITEGIISSFSSGTSNYIYLKDTRRPGNSLYVDFRKDQKGKILNLAVGQRIVVKGQFEPSSYLRKAELLPSNTKIEAVEIPVIETTLTLLNEEYKVPLRAAEKYKGKHMKFSARVTSISTSSSSNRVYLYLEDDNGTRESCYFSSSFRNDLLDLSKNDYVEITAYCNEAHLYLKGVALKVIDRIADREPIKVLMSRLWSAYKKDPIGTSEKYNNQPIIVRGKLNRISTSSDGSISANLYDRGHFSCSFSKKDAVELKGISPRRSVYVIGIVSPSSNKDYIYLESCRLQKK